jgi:hypothetical protein
VPAAVLIVMVVDPDPVTEAGMKLAVAPADKPEAVKLTTLLNAVVPITVTM